MIKNLASNDSELEQAFFTEPKCRQSACQRLTSEDLAPRARFELATLRLTASRVVLSKLAGNRANREESASCDETEQTSFSFSFPVFVRNLP